MKIPEFTVRHPVLTSMVALIVVILGVVALRQLPLDLMPDISYPMLSVNTTYANSSPHIVEELITRPIEEVMSAVPGVEQITSESAEGSSNVQLTFAWGTDLEAAANDVRDRLDRVLGRLPDDAERPHLFKFDPSSAPILSLGVLGDVDPVYLRQLVDEQLSYRLERVDGVASVDIWGGTNRQVQVNLRPDRLQVLGLSVDQVISRITSANVESPIGTVVEGSFQRSLRASALYENLGELADTVVAVRDGTPVALREVADVADGTAKETRITRINGRTGIRMAVSKQSGRNTVEVARILRREVERIREDYPQLELIVISDSSRYIGNSLTNVAISALSGAFIAAAVLLVFLRSLRSTLIISISIPFSMIATFVLMYAAGITLNVMSLGGLAMGVGMMVDNSIVVLENSYRLRREGRASMEAAVEGAGEVTAAVIASTLTTIVVFLPLVFTRGVTGILYKQLAIVVSFALLASLASALTLVPMLSSRLLARPLDSHGGRLSEALGRGLAGLERVYGALLDRVLKHPGATVVVVAAVLAASLLLVPLIGSETMPSSDEGEVRLSGELALGTRLELTDELFRGLEQQVRQAVPETQTMMSSAGGGRASGSSTGQINLTLVPRRQRSRSDAQVADDLRRRLAGTPGVTLRTRTSQGSFMPRMGGQGAERIQIEIRGYDLDAGRKLARRILDIVEGVPGVTDVQFGQQEGVPEDLLVVDRRRVAELDLTMQQVTSVLRTLVGGSQAGIFREAANERPIVVRLAAQDPFDMGALLALPVVNGQGRAVPLANVVSVRRQIGPTVITRKDQERMIALRANTSGRDVGSIVDDARERIRAVPVPSGLSVRFTGDWEQQQESFRELAISIALSLLLIFMVMAGLYESLRDPFIIMFSIPLSAIGVLVTLFLTRTTFNIQTWIGVLMLGGIVVNNAILLVDTMNHLRRLEGKTLLEAVRAAGRRRLRPVLMTSLTTMVGLLPLAIGLGEGGELQASLARTVIGGLASATFITLLFIPCLYLLFERRRERRKGATA
jgi:HAE1 family hydrophobic/amphiphilic exporter-1